MRFSSRYENKIDAFKKSIKLLGFKIEDILKQYQNINFEDTEFSKLEIFNQIVNKSLDKNHKQFLDDKGKALTHFRDAREGYEYLTDLILGWLVEDAILLKFKLLGIASNLCGNDRYREFLTPKKISTQPDIIIGKSSTRTLEIVSDWKNTWKDENHIDFRDNKFIKLLEKETLIFGIAPTNNLGFVIDLPKDKDYFKENFIYQYHKNGYTNWNIREVLVPLDKAILKVEEIFKKLH